MVKRPEPLKFFIFLILLAGALLYVSAAWRAGGLPTTGSGGPGITVGSPSEPGVTVPGDVLVTGPSEATGAGSAWPVTAGAGAPGADAGAGQDYYVEARLERERTRSQEADILQRIVDDPQSSGDARQKAEQALLAIARKAEEEGDAEAILKAKGYDDAIVFLADASATVVLKTFGLTPSDVAVAADAVGRAAGLPAEDVNVVARP